MKKTSAIFFLVVLVSAQTPAGELFKLPALVDHFVKHQKQDGDLFFGFLAEHYSPSHNDADLPEDENLPFKNVSFNTVCCAIVPPAIKANAIIPVPPGKKPVFTDRFIAQQHLSRIFHPPRLVS